MTNWLDFTKTIAPIQPSALWAIDSEQESIQARGIIVKYYVNGSAPEGLSGMVFVPAQVRPSNSPVLAPLTRDIERGATT